MKYLKKLFFLSYFFIINANAQVSKDSITIENYKEKIPEKYYKFQYTEDMKYLNEVLQFIKLNNINFKEEYLINKIEFLKGANNYFNLRRYENVDMHLDKAYKLAKKLNDYYLMGTIDNIRGLKCNKVELDTECSEYYYLSAIENYKKINEISQQIDSYYNLILNYRDKKEWKLSIQSAEICLSLFKDSEKKIEDYSRIFHFLFDNYLELNDFDKALIYLEKLKKYDTNSNDDTKNLLYDAYARYYTETKKYPLAIQSYKKKIEGLVSKYRKSRDLLKDAYQRELALENKVNKQKVAIIKTQNKRIYISRVFALCSLILVIVLVFLLRNINKKNKKINLLNESLEITITKLKEKNADLSNNKTKIENLLKLNEESLFSSVLKISTYNDSIKKISEEIEQHTENSNLKTDPFFITVNKKLFSLISEDESWEDFKNQFEKIRPNFFKKLKVMAPSLSINDLKHCTYIVSDLKSKDVSSLIHISTRSVETVRYRIKKKLGLKKEESLYDLLKTL